MAGAGAGLSQEEGLHVLLLLSGGDGRGGLCHQEDQESTESEPGGLRFVSCEISQDYSEVPPVFLH